MNSNLNLKIYFMLVDKIPKKGLFSDIRFSKDEKNKIEKQ